MKKFLLTLIIVLPFIFLAQPTQAQVDSTTTDTTCFTQEEINGLYTNIRELEKSDSLKTEKIELQRAQINHLNTQISNYKDLNTLKDEHINLLDKRLNLKNEKIDLLEKKIRRNKIKHVLTGAAAGGLIMGLVIGL